MQFPNYNRLAALPFLDRLLPNWQENRPSSEDSQNKRGERPKIGLALSSGGAKGLTHIGVIQVLEEHQIPIDMIAGTSMGSYIGACWASGLTGKEMETLAGEIQTPRDRIHLLDPVFPPRKGFLRGHKVRKRLQKSIGERDFSELKIPLAVIATEMGTYRSHVIKTGNVADAVHASSAIPGICWPVEIDGSLFVDGGVANPLPVNALLEAGMDFIIAVNVIPSVSQLQAEKVRAAESEPPVSGLRRVSRWFNKHFNYFAAGNILDTLRSSALGAQIRVAEFSGEQAHVHLRPSLCTGDWHDYHNSGKYIQAGRECAEAHLNEILALLEEPTSPNPSNPKLNHA
tara:strand:+ start:14134 stop:15162 length:1029 start_codon:yes stop_codon:yes gene_type:complete